MKERANKFLKNIDFLLGIPIVFILGLIKKVFRRKVSYDEVRSIGILKEAAIGDLAILTGIIKDLAMAFPQAKIVLLCSKANSSLAKLIKVENEFEVITLPLTNFFDTLKIVFNLSHFDLFFDFGQWARINAILSFFINSKVKVGFKTKGQFRHYIYDVVVEHSEEIHEIENFWKQLEFLNIKTKSMPFLEVVEKDLTLPKSFVVFHILPGGSKANLKKWDLDKWLFVGTYLIEKGYNIVLTGGKEDFEYNEVLKWKFEHEGIKSSKVENYAGVTLEETIYILSKSTLVISVDTGIIHIASALNLKLIGLYGPTSPKRWGPLCKNAIAISHENECKPCISLGFESKCEKSKCMELITTSEVIEAIDSLL